MKWSDGDNRDAGMKTSVSVATQALRCLFACSAWAGEENRTDQQPLIKQWEIKSSKVRPNMHWSHWVSRETYKGRIDKICWGAVTCLKRPIWSVSVPKEPVTGSHPSCVAFMPFSIFITTERVARGERQCSQRAIKTWRQSGALGSRTLVILWMYAWIAESGARCLSEQ